MYSPSPIQNRKTLSDLANSIQELPSWFLLWGLGSSLDEEVQRERFYKKKNTIAQNALKETGKTTLTNRVQADTMIYREIA